jgi:hypothetical protein
MTLIPKTLEAITIKPINIDINGKNIKLSNLDKLIINEIKSYQLQYIKPKFNSVKDLYNILCDNVTYNKNLLHIFEYNFLQLVHSGLLSLYQNKLKKSLIDSGKPAIQILNQIEFKLLDLIVKYKANHLKKVYIVIMNIQIKGKYRTDLFIYKHNPFTISTSQNTQKELVNNIFHMYYKKFNKNIKLTQDLIQDICDTGLNAKSYLKKHFADYVYHYVGFFGNPYNLKSLQYLLSGLVPAIKHNWFLAEIIFVNNNKNRRPTFSKRSIDTSNLLGIDGLFDKMN